MAASDLTVTRLRELLHYDQSTGVFTRAKAHAGRPIGAVVGFADKDGYLSARVDGKAYRLNRLAWFYAHGEWPAGEVDHRDGVKQDNRLTNLRDTSRAINAQNLRQARSHNATQLLGVGKEPGTKRWRARITVNGKLKRLGSFPTPEAAHAAYLIAKRQLHTGNTL